MQLHRMLSSLVIATTLIGTPLVASAEPAPIAAQSTPAPKPAVDDAKRYAQLEKESPAAAKFQGDGAYVYIGGGAVTVVLVLLLIVIIL